MRIEKLRRNYEIEIRWVAFPLHPETPEEGHTLEQLFAGRNVDIKQIIQRLKQVADELGLPITERNMIYNSRLAQELGKWAESKGKGDPYHDAVFHAYFVEGKNIGKIDELIALAKSLALTEEEARNVLESRIFKEAVDADWERSHALGVTAVPTFVINHRSVVGAQPYETLEQLLKTSGVKKREET